MKFNINSIKLGLFAGNIQCLNLDTGTFRSKRSIDRKWERMPKNAKMLPRYSRALVYQKYLCEMLPKTTFEDTIHLEEYPDFPLVVTDDGLELEVEFVSKADHFLSDPDWYDFECRNEERGLNGSPDYDSTFIPYLRFADAFKREKAIEWCEQEGYEWYESDEPFSTEF